jgi:sugar lactone lactonase YvrE
MGERSRLSVARALASGAGVQVMDEPLAHVDPARSPRYWEVIRKAVRSSGASLIFATHAPETVLREADRVICLAEGKVVFEGNPWHLYNDPPRKELAEFLGPVNWFEQEDQSHWLPATENSPRSVRPERLQIQPAAEGHIEIERIRFAGGISEADLVNVQTRQRRTFFHRPAIQSLRPGQRVAIEVLTFCLLLLLGTTFSGCRESAGQDHLLAFRQVDHANLPSEGAMLPAPRGLTFNAQGELFVLDNAGRVLVYDAQGKLARQWWMPEYSAGKPEGACVLHDGRVAIADTHYHRVLFFDHQGNPAGSWGSLGEGPGQFIYTVAVTQDARGFVYVAEYGGNDRVQKFTPDGGYVLTIGKPGMEPGEFQRASGVSWKEGIVYVADSINNRVHAFRDDGTFLNVIADAKSAGLHYPYDMALSPDGTLWLAEYGGNRITQISTSGELLGHWGSPGRGLDQLWTPWGIAISPSGKVIVADTGNRRLVELQR